MKTTFEGGRYLFIKEDGEQKSVFLTSKEAKMIAEMRLWHTLGFSEFRKDRS